MQTILQNFKKQVLLGVCFLCFLCVCFFVGFFGVVFLFLFVCLGCFYRFFNKQHAKLRKEGNVLFNDPLNTF